MTHPFIIMLSGLMALVPDSSGSLSPMSAYLLGTDSHNAELSVFGDVKLSSVGDGALCQPISDRFIKCDFSQAQAEVDIDLSGLKANGVPSLPDPPSDNVNDNNEFSPGWLVQMWKVYPGRSGAGVAKDENSLKSLASVRLRSFPWTRARSLQLDGSELGHAARIGFRTDDEITYASSQAGVAESMLFIADTDEAGWQMKVGSQVITVGPNASMILSNNLSDVSCTNGENDGDHFLGYYALLAQPIERQDERRPHRLIPPDRKCVGEDHVKISPNAREGIVEVLTPIDADAVKSLQSFSGDSWPAFKNAVGGALGPVVAASVGHGPFSRAKNMASAAFLQELVLFYVTDRIVCPPVLLDSPTATAVSTTKRGSGTNR
jgi:hypothetical protein